MRKQYLFLTLILFVIPYGFAQFTFTEKTDNPMPQQWHQKSSDNGWDVQFAKTVAPKCMSPIGMVSDGNYLYSGSAAKAIIYKIGFDSKLLDSTTVYGLPRSNMGTYCAGMAFDGQSMYISNGGNYIYRLNSKMDSVVETITLSSDILAASLTYDPSADNGNGAFWTSYPGKSLYLVSRSGSILNTITLEDLEYENAEIWGITFDTSTSSIYALERYPQNIIRINTATKSVTAPIHCVADDQSAWQNYYAYGIYIQKGVYSDTTTTLGVFFMSHYHIGYDYATVNQMPDNSVIVGKTKMEKFHKVNTPKSIYANFINRGNNPLQSFIFKYEADGELYCDTISGKNYSNYLKGTTITHSTTFTPTVCDSTYTIKLWLENINGTGISTDTLTFSFETYLKGTQRCVLHEAFTSATCSPCKVGNENLKNIFSSHDNWVCIKYQMSWPGDGDPYYTPEGYTRRSYYKISSVPYLAADGNYYLGSSTNYTSDLLEEEIPKPSLVEMEGSLVYDNEKSFTAEIKATPLKDIEGDIRLFAALVEYKTVKNIADEYLNYYGGAKFYANWDSVFFYVMKKFITPASGTAVTLKEDSLLTFNLEYEFNGDYRLPGNASDYINNETENSVEDFHRVFLVYWLQDYNTKEVFQAGKAGEAASSVKSASTLANVTVYPNPAHGQMNILSDVPFTQIRLINMAGQTIFRTNTNADSYQLNVQDYAEGLYILQLQTANGTVNTKVQIR